MKRAQLIDGASAGVLAFEWLVDAVSPVSVYGERHFSELAPFAPGNEAAAQSRAERIAEIAQEVGASALEALRTALNGLPDVAGTIARASMGAVLSDASFFELRRFSATIARIDALHGGSGRLGSSVNDSVHALADALVKGQNGENEFYLAEAFDPKLAAARSQLQRAQAELDALRGRESQRVARELGREELGIDEFIVMRAELRGALPEGVRVLREAPTYFLCGLEYGEAALSALARRDAAAQNVAHAEETVREKLSAIVQNNAAGLIAATTAIGELDVLVGAARFTQRFGCVPAVVSDEPVLALQQARFLPLELELAAVRRPFIPLDLELHDTAVLTGPNMGGKSVCLLTCGFIALCAAFGLPVPATAARVGLFGRIAWLGTGRDPQVGGLLSSFAQEVLVLKDILLQNTQRLLILVDEFARTTTPHEGKALSIALLERLRTLCACGMVATHLEGLAVAAGVRHYSVRGLAEIPMASRTGDVSEALAALAGSMDYRIVEVRGEDPARADAIALSALLGVDREFIDAAYRALSQ